MYKEAPVSKQEPIKGLNLVAIGITTNVFQHQHNPHTRPEDPPTAKLIPNMRHQTSSLLFQHTVTLPPNIDKSRQRQNPHPKLGTSPRFESELWCFIGVALFDNVHLNTVSQSSTKTLLCFLNVEKGASSINTIVVFLKRGGVVS